MGRTITNSMEVKERLTLQYKAVNRKRVEAGKPRLTYGTLAEACDISESAVNKWFGKKDRVAPNTENLIVLAPLLECDVDYLLGIQDTPNREVFNVCASTGLSEEAAETLVKMAKEDDILLPLLSSLITSRLPACILPAVLTKGRKGYINYGMGQPSEYISAEDNIALQKLRAQESLFLFINKLREENGLDPLE